MPEGRQNGSSHMRNIDTNNSPFTTTTTIWQSAVKPRSMHVLVPNPAHSSRLSPQGCQLAQDLLLRRHLL